MAAKRVLLESDSEGEYQAPPRLKINEEYAKRLAHNKKREDLHRLQELQKRGLVESDSEENDEEEDEEGVIPQRTEVKIFETLARIKKQDPSIYQPDVKFFGEGDDDEDEESENTSGKDVVRKPVFLKDVVAQHALENSDEDSDDRPDRRTFKTYNEEQQELKDAFLKGVAEAVENDDEETLFKVRKKSKEESEQEAEGSNKDLNISRRLEEYFGKDDYLDENDKFLKDYLLNQGWVDKDKDKIPSYEDIVGGISEDEAELDKQDEYEAKFNFRFQEGAGSRVLGHSRIVENSVRKLPEKRKEQRKKKEARLSEVELARQEEVKRLKNVKKKEIMERMSKIKAVAGIASLEKLNEDDLEEDFDPAEYDKKMSEVFSEEGYYNDKDPDAKFHSDDDEADIVKPDFDAEDEALGLPVGWDGREKEGFAAVHEKQKSQDRKSMLLQEKEEIEKKLEEYYKLDYEDMVGDLPTRFKYAQVKANNFGLNAAQILDADDSELNQYVSLKALAPYRTEEWLPRHKHQRLTKKERKRRALDQVPSLGDKSKKQELEGTEEQVVQGEHDSENSPEKKKRKKRRESTESEHGEMEKKQNGEVAKADDEITEEQQTKKKKRKKQAESMEPEQNGDVVKAKDGKNVETTDKQQTGDQESTKKKKKKKQTESTGPEHAQTEKQNGDVIKAEDGKNVETTEQTANQESTKKKKKKEQTEFMELEHGETEKKQNGEVAKAEDGKNVEITEEQQTGDQESTKKKKKKKHTESTEPKDTETGALVEKKREVPNAEDGENVETTEDQQTGDQESTKKKRKRKKQGLNMSKSRLISYGKIDLPKRKKY